MTLPTAIDRAKKFIRLIERYDNFDELTPTIINEFVEKILFTNEIEKAVKPPIRKSKSTSTLSATMNHRKKNYPKKKCAEIKGGGRKRTGKKRQASSKLLET